MEENCQDTENDRWKRDGFVAIGTGVGVATAIGVGAFAVGSVSGGKARLLVEATMPTSRFLCSSVMAALATILALMLTLLSISSNSDKQLRSTFYKRVQQVSFYAMVFLIAAVVFLVLHCIPLAKADELPDWWMPTVYYSMLSVAAALGGATATIVVMLYTAIRDLICIFGLEQDHRLREDEQCDC